VLPVSNVPLTPSTEWGSSMPFNAIFPAHGATAPGGPGPPRYRGFTIKIRHTSFGRTPLDEWSARRIHLYPATHNTHKTQTSTPRQNLALSLPVFFYISAIWSAYLTFFHSIDLQTLWLTQFTVILVMYFSPSPYYFLYFKVNIIY
jgi:hypothetical protein